MQGSTHSTPTAPGLGLGPPMLGSASFGGLGGGQLPSLPPRPSMGFGGDMRRPSGFGSPFNAAASGFGTGVGPGGGSEPSRLGQGSRAVSGAYGQLPDSLYGGGAGGGGDEPPPQRAPSRGLSVTAKPFTMTGSTSFTAAQWGAATAGAGAGGASDGSGGPTPRSASSAFTSPAVPGPLAAPYPSGPAAAGFGAGGGYSSATAAMLSRGPFGSNQYIAPPPPGGGQYLGGGAGGRATPGGYSTPSLSPTAASLLPHGMSAPIPGSAQSMSSLAGPPPKAESDGAPAPRSAALLCAARLAARLLSAAGCWQQARRSPGPKLGLQRSCAWAGCAPQPRRPRPPRPSPAGPSAPLPHAQMRLKTCAPTLPRSRVCRRRRRPPRRAPSGKLPRPACPPPPSSPLPAFTVHACLGSCGPGWQAVPQRAPAAEACLENCPFPLLAQRRDPSLPARPRPCPPHRLAAWRRQ